MNNLELHSEEFNFLEDLRKSGVIDKITAHDAIPHLKAEFGFNNDEARDVIRLWLSKVKHRREVG